MILSDANEQMLGSPWNSAQHKAARTDKWRYILRWGKRLCAGVLLSVVLPYTAQAATNTGLSGDDVQAGPFPIGFEFKYYGQTFDQFYATTNGLLQFSGATTAYSNTSLPASHNNTLYVFWDDLRTNVSGQTEGVIQYEMQGEAPNRRLIVQWTNQYFYGSNLPMGTFQAILYEGSNQIKYQYRDLLDERSFGNSATIGMQGPARQAIQLGYNTANTVAPETVFSFTPAGDGTEYQRDDKAEFNFIDISGLSPNRPVPVARYASSELGWAWSKIDTLDMYEVRVQDQEGNAIYNEVVGDVDRFVYADTVKHGESYRARVRGSINQGGTWEAWSSLSTPVTVDTNKPVATLNDFVHTSTSAVKVSYAAADDLSGVQNIHLQIATDAGFSNLAFNGEIPAGTGNYTVGNMPQSNNLYARISATDRAGNVSDFSAVKEISLGAPVIVTPANGSTVYQPKMTVSGTAGANNKVQLYVNDVATGSLLTVDALGKFTTSVTLVSEGKYSIAAKSQSELGESELGSHVEVIYKATVPVVSITSPAEGAIITNAVDVQANAVDEAGISKVEIFVGNKRLASMASAPYQARWDISNVVDGEHTIKVVVSNVNGKTTSITRQVTVKQAPDTPDVPLTYYTGTIDSIEPAISYGEQPIVIKGQALERDTGKPVVYTRLVIALKVGNFNRRINVTTDEAGNFSYIFKPQATDAGKYIVSVIHPDEEATTEQGSFTVDRLRFNISGYNLRAARTIEQTINVSATASAATQGLRWVMRAEDQPDGVLPAGIQIVGDNGGNGVDIAAGRTVPVSIKFVADNTAAEKGSIHLVALTADTNELVRGTLQVNYTLVDPAPTLYTTPRQIQTGVQQESSVTESVTLGNSGLATAQNVRVELLDERGNKPPIWVFLGSSGNIGSIKADGNTALQLTAQPGTSVANGIYKFILRVSADNANGGDIPISVSVTQSGLGSVQFDVADLFTQTKDKDDNLILGVKDVSLKLQNEAVLTEIFTFKTDVDGIALAQDLPVGIYLFRASAKNHEDVSGRIRVLPGITTNHHIFMNYETITIEFDVTETTIDDVYEIELEATFETEVPAPVVLLEPLGINLGGMQVGEEKTGRLTLTNYGLVQADDLNIQLPQSDSRFSYEFMATIPDVLPAKSSIVIPYRVVALGDAQAAGDNTGGITPRSLASAGDNGSIKPMLRAMARSSAADCDSYSKVYTVGYSWECANGEKSKKSQSGSFYSLVGNNCGGSGGGWAGGGSGGGGSGFGGSTGSPSPVPMAPECVPECPTGDCDKGGGSASR